MTLEQFLVLQQWSIIAFLGVLLLISFANLAGMRRLGTAAPGQGTPPVSVLVPARDEAGNIEACVRSLLAQEYPDYELIVLDDESKDATAEILARLAAEAPPLRVLPGRPLPPGWVGKNWACHQLAQAASGAYLLFTDADTVHHPAMLADTIALAQSTRADFLSAIPAQQAVTWAERLAVPMIPWMEHTIVPVALMRRWPYPLLANANGQFILFRREAYALTGGHAAVRSSVIEDFALSRRVKRHGLRWDLVDASARVRTRMYPGWSQVWDGFSKNLFAAFGYNLAVFAFIWLWMLYVAWAPLAWILLALLCRPLPGVSLPLAALSLGMQVVLWAIPNLRFRLPLGQALLFPLTVTLFAAIAARSAYRHLARKPVSWKGRRL
ncbi:MAG: glycosyltransferase family 2 protein [Chloroflexota bacterium]